MPTAFQTEEKHRTGKDHPMSTRSLTAVETAQSTWRKFLLIASTGILLAALFMSRAFAADTPTFKLAWSIYTGYMPWQYAEQSGILKKWADKYKIKIELTQINDYIESINQYTAGQFDGVADTNMDSLTIPAAGGVDTTIVILGDYSNGNDAIFVKGKGKKFADIKGQEVSLVQLSVSHYMLWRALQTNGMKESDITTSNISDADFIAVWGTPKVKAEVVWNPATADIVKDANASMVYDSSKMPGELQDVISVNTKVAKEHPEFVKAIVGAWYETLGVMQKGDKTATDAKTMMATGSGTDLAGFEGQLKTTHLYYSPAEAVTFLKSADLPKITDLVMTFSFEHGLLGDKAKSKDEIGIELPGGKILGDKSNVKLRFDPSFMEMAADGKL
jgi:NitT/TauT family transport system substrate-binding protein